MKKAKKNGGPGSAATSDGHPGSAATSDGHPGSAATSDGHPETGEGSAADPVVKAALAGDDTALAGGKIASSGGKVVPASTVGKIASSGGKIKPEPPLEPLQIGSAIYDTRITWKFRNRKNWARPDERLVTAFIPGTIQKIFIQEGMQVETGTPLLILEAMKMRNEVLSPVSGTITHVYVNEGDQVPKNHLLVEFAFH